MIRLVLAEDQSLLRGALATLLSLEDDIDVIAQACDGLEALALVEEHQPNILVTDIEMPNLSGIELAEKVAQLNSPPNVLIVTTFARPGYLERARAAGVKGYVLKDASSESLADSIRKVMQGQIVIEQGLAEAAWAAPDPLSNREREILRLVEKGKTNKEIGNELHLSAGTVRNYLADATQKLAAANRIEASRKARENGWL